jgi:hypothetical protein
MELISSTAERGSDSAKHEMPDIGLHCVAGKNVAD